MLYNMLCIMLLILCSMLNRTLYHVLQHIMLQLSAGRSAFAWWPQPYNPSPGWHQLGPLISRLTCIWLEENSCGMPGLCYASICPSSAPLAQQEQAQETSSGSLQPFWTHRLYHKCHHTAQQTWTNFEQILFKCPCSRILQAALTCTVLLARG